jgi:hypothetical protein
VTVLPGDELYSVFGHSMLRFRDPALGFDASFNWGTFDFGGSPLAEIGFVARFAYGDLEYSLSVQGTEPVLRWYWEEKGRASFEQELDLDPGQRARLYALVRENYRPENRTYRYDFFFDNCATRIVDLLEAATGGTLVFTAAPPGGTFRSLLDPYLADRPFLHAAMDAGLGLPADRRADARGAAFLPLGLDRLLASGRLPSADGVAARPLVAGTRRLFGDPEAFASPVPRPRPDWPAILLWALFGGALITTAGDLRRGRRRPRRALDGGLFLVTGAAGLLLAFLWFVSLHTVTKANLNLAWAFPGHLVAGIVILRGRRPRWLGAYTVATAVASAAFLACAPISPQRLPAAVLPIAALLVLRSAWLALRARRPSRDSG